VAAALDRAGGKSKGANASAVTGANDNQADGHHHRPARSCGAPRAPALDLEGHCLIPAIFDENGSVLFLVPAPGCHHNGIAVLHVGVDAERIQAPQFPEIETGIAVLEVPPSAGAHLPGCVSERFDNSLASQLVVGIHHD